MRRYRRSPPTSVLALVTGLLLGSGGPVQASPLDLFGFGGRSPGLAGTGVATSTGYDAVYLNPAGLADAADKRVTLGTVAGTMDLYLNQSRADTDAIRGLVIGGAVPLPLGGPLRDRVGLGLGFHIPTAAINRARHPLPGEPTYALLANRTHVVAIQIAAGVKLDRRWRLGVGVLALAELRGTIDVTTDAAGRFTTFSEQRLLTRATPIVGARYLAPARGLAAGLTLRGASRSDYDITVTNDLGDALPLTIPTVRIAGASQYDPLTAAAEASWQPRAAITINAQLAYQRWSAYPQPTLAPVADAPPEPPPGFHDTVVPRVAAEVRLDAGPARLGLRGGYALFWSPAPEMDGRQSLLDNHRHIVSAGLGLEGPGWPVHIDAWTQVHALVPRTHTKDPAKFEPDQELPFESVDTRGRIVAGGVTVGVDL